MLLQFSIKNFKSIVDLTLDFSFAEGKAPNGYKEYSTWPFLEKNGKRVVPCLALYGPNASGKSNSIKAIFTFRKLVLDGTDRTYFPNKLVNYVDNTEFSMKFIGKNNIFTYTIRYFEDVILYEELKNDTMTFFCVGLDASTFNIPDETTIYTPEKLKSIFDVECTKDGHQTYSFLSKIGRNYPGLNSDISNIYNFIHSKIGIAQNNDIPVSAVLQNFARDGADNKIQEAFVAITKILRKLDIDITRMEFRRDKFTPRNSNIPGDILLADNGLFLDSIISYHIDQAGNEVPFNFKTDESNGTQVSAGIIGILLYALQEGQALFVDELDSSLHPILFTEIVRLFKSKRYNKGNAQLVFTAHDTELLDSDVMRISEVGITNKTLKKGTTLKRISDFEKTRNVTNFRKRYMDGEYTGIPFPYI